MFYRHIRFGAKKVRNEYYIARCISELQMSWIRGVTIEVEPGNSRRSGKPRVTTRTPTGKAKANEAYGHLRACQFCMHKQLKCKPRLTNPTFQNPSRRAQGGTCTKPLLCLINSINYLSSVLPQIKGQIKYMDSGLKNFQIKECIKVLISNLIQIKI